MKVDLAVVATAYLLSAADHTTQIKRLIYPCTLLSYSSAASGKAAAEEAAPAA